MWEPSADEARQGDPYRPGAECDAIEQVVLQGTGALDPGTDRVGSCHRWTLSAAVRASSASARYAIATGLVGWESTTGRLASVLVGTRRDSGTRVRSRGK